MSLKEYLSVEKGLKYLVIKASTLHGKEYHKEITPIYDFLVEKRDEIGLDTVLKTFNMLLVTLILTNMPYEAQKVYDYLFEHTKELGFEKVVIEIHIVMITLVRMKKETEVKPVFEYLQQKQKAMYFSSSPAFPFVQ